MIVNGVCYKESTSPAVIRALENARASHERIRIFYGSVDTGLDWGEIAMRGTIRSSMGPLKVPLLIKTSRSYGGEAILDHCIIRIESSPGGRVIYSHPKFHHKSEERAA